MTADPLERSQLNGWLMTDRVWLEHMADLDGPKGFPMIQASFFRSLQREDFKRGEKDRCKLVLMGPAAQAFRVIAHSRGWGQTSEGRESMPTWREVENAYEACKRELNP